MAVRAREWMMLGVVVVVTTALFLLVLRWLAPQLLGLPVDLRLVQVDERVPAFYDGVFRPEDHSPGPYMINDPVTVVRARPRVREADGMGPNDILGFRNVSVPNVADIITIGDSQTYGNNALLEENWPSQMLRRLPAPRPLHYSIAAGGWGAVQYLEMVTKATVFAPQVIVVAFYTGNDALETFITVHGSERWADLRVDPSLAAGDAPSVSSYPPRPEELWPAGFEDGVRTVFTPRMRLVPNSDHPAVAAGYEIMVRVAGEIRRLTRPFNVRLVFTAIPTKELVFAQKVARAGLDAPADYRALVEAERRRLDTFAARVRAIEGAVYVDVLAPMSRATLDGAALYAEDTNGHPAAGGHAVIGDAVAAAVQPLMAQRPFGIFNVEFSPEDRRIVLIRPNGVWLFESIELVARNGWQIVDRAAHPRALMGLPRCGVIREVDPRRFGPDAGARPEIACR